MRRSVRSVRADKKHFRRTARDKKVINAGVLYRGGIRL